MLRHDESSTFIGRHIRVNVRESQVRAYISLQKFLRKSVLYKCKRLQHCKPSRMMHLHLWILQCKFYIFIPCACSEKIARLKLNCVRLDFFRWYVATSRSRGSHGNIIHRFYYYSFGLIIWKMKVFELRWMSSKGNSLRICWNARFSMISGKKIWQHLLFWGAINQKKFLEEGFDHLRTESTKKVQFWSKMNRPFRAILNRAEKPENSKKFFLTMSARFQIDQNWPKWLSYIPNEHTWRNFCYTNGIMLNKRAECQKNPIFRQKRPLDPTLGQY